MTQAKIHQIYKWLGYSLGVLSFLLIVTPFANFDFSDRFWFVLSLNLGFHFFYHGIFLASLSQLIWMKGHSVITGIAKQVFIASSYIFIAGSFLIAINVIVDSFSKGEFYQLTTLFCFAGLALGALKLNFELRGKR